MARETLHPRLILAVAAVATAAFALSGCTTEDPAPVPTSDTPSAAPVFASDEEALAAAEEAYSKYLTVTDQVFANGGHKPEHFTSVASGSALSSLEADAAEFLEKKVRSTGSTSFKDLALQGFALNELGETVTQIYVCEDVSEIDILNAAGDSLVSPDRQAKQGFEVALVRSPGSLKELVITREPWNGDGVCV